MGKRFHPDSAPEFCVIAPTEYIALFAAHSNTHLVLAHIVDTDDAYAAIYHRFSESGHKIIMDNGAFELGESYAPERLIELGKKCGAHALVLPDYPGQPGTKTIEAADAIIDQVIDAGFETMFVPQSEVGEFEDWVSCYQWAADNPDIDIIGMSILGIPNALPEVHRGYARVVMSSILLDRDIAGDKYHHYLGLNSGPALEIPSLIHMGMLNSCDSSGPVWAAICGHEYSYNADSYQYVSKIKKAVDFNYPYRHDDIALTMRIEHNLRMTKALFQ